MPLPWIPCKSFRCAMLVSSMEEREKGLILEKIFHSKVNFVLYVSGLAVKAIVSLRQAISPSDRLFIRQSVI